jgi:hypothetical protein
MVNLVLVNRTSSLNVNSITESYKKGSFGSLFFCSLTKMISCLRGGVLPITSFLAFYTDYG